MLRRAIAPAFSVLLLLTGFTATSAVFTTGDLQPAPRHEALERDFAYGFRSAVELHNWLDTRQNPAPLVCSHRAGPEQALPENSISALHNGLRLGPLVPEIDLRQSADGRIVIIHDETLDRTTTGSGPVGEQTFLQLRQHRLVANDGTVLEDRIPSLEEALAWAEGRAVLMLDIKRDVDPEVLIPILKATNAENRSILIVYNFDDLFFYHDQLPHIAISAPIRNRQDLQRVIDGGFPLRQLVAWLGVGNFDPELVRELNGRGIRTSMGTFRQIDGQAQSEGASVFRAFFDQGLGMVSTDVPSVAAPLAHASQPRTTVGASR